MISGEALLELIPQREPMLLVDRFFGITEGVSRAGLRIAEDNIFCEEGLLREYGVIEHIAQSAAARIGYIYRRKGLKVPVGFIGSVDKMTLYILPEVGSELLSEIRVEQEVGDITLISARVMCAEAVIAEGRMKIFLNKEGQV